ncbi:helix-turn-helix domain-containing protein [Jannaschia rubra]|uniref:Helix-turn-helix domain protein n=1 Tax=Jannaschia rubra TaxID=282197 RepID=A0A0M6XS13_9RHOB|nr:helix-turn-helix domain-containing protein [Jannaschia rubra]CTQ33929.1 Helix-turn-helix domain protein [Jannaschia rubra]SFG76396.1 Helix-turn-helix domain-containing protein [Jannaschia rubra]
MEDNEHLMIDEYLTTNEVARKLKRSPRTIRDYIADGCLTPRGRIYLDGTKVGKSWLIHPEWLELFEHRIRPVRRADLDLE